ncbi:MAG TPA: tRNA pseudouridine(38-40) synthase TruA [Gemmatimonadales bacterium]|nr:tRNA pseudouridine(38-40) synthase TruA [Gemmatimonadales bacterium]
MSRTYLALLHYDGRDFAGWQRQPESRTVQAEIERVLEQLGGRRIVAHGAGRTDAGVHAKGMGVSFAVPEKWTAESLRRALNALLPPDCWVESLSEMRPGFHARKCATGRRYRYDIGTDDASASPFRRPYEWALARPLDGGRLERAAAMIVGTHEFPAFAVRRPVPEDGIQATSGAHPGRPYECSVRRAEWEPRDQDRGFRFHVEADRFLHHMVRFLVGTMVDIGLGRRPIEDMATLLTSADNQATSPPAPPQGLYFVGAEYPADWYLQPDGRMEGTVTGQVMRGTEVAR